MLVKRIFIILLIVGIPLLGAVACTANTQGESSAELAASDTESVANQAGGGDGIEVEVTPMSDEDLAAQPETQTEPEASAADDDSQAAPETQEFFQAGTSVYTDDAYKFSIDYPANFVFRTLPTEDLTYLNPMPTASFTWMNPETAASDSVELEPADLELRVHASNQVESLEDWLTSAGLLPADGSVPIQPFETANVVGVQVCASTMIAPGCSYFFSGNGWVYQLTPATLEGEAMSSTFKLLP